MCTYKCQCFTFYVTVINAMGNWLCYNIYKLCNSIIQNATAYWDIVIHCISCNASYKGAHDNWLIYTKD